MVAVAYTAAVEAAEANIEALGTVLGRGSAVCFLWVCKMGEYNAVKALGAVLAMDSLSCSWWLEACKIVSASWELWRAGNKLVPELETWAQLMAMVREAVGCFQDCFERFLKSQEIECGCMGGRNAWW